MDTMAPCPEKLSILIPAKNARGNLEIRKNLNQMVLEIFFLNMFISGFNLD